MKTNFKAFLGVAALALAVGAPAMAETVKSVTTKSSAVAPDGSVAYESQTTITRAPVKPGAVTFYYYDPKLGAIVAGQDLTDGIIDLWDTNKNKVIDNHEFYTNAMVVYEPIEYSKRTYQDIDGQLKLTQEEYTLRLQQLPEYRNLNKDGKEGLTLYEFTGVGFQDADHNNDNQVSYDELKQAFYAKEGIIRKPLKQND
ncbi:MAG: hypothetical protein DI626_04320 [Micavibrio aeruginosavorus]|uniref:EF-hand domain-containing protein n=1 Tax=Micavibrio aeruginosavorus TaxID=349221 RepID=A0A2W5A1S2_9BACT|nr:MAG: hypothetical protein DI626_04320 [Micavibrio aeruginosavorus]